MPANFQPIRLKQARFLKRMTQDDLSEMVEVKKQSINQFEKGHRSPAPDTLGRLALALEVPIEFFLRPQGRLEAAPRTMVHFRSRERARETIRDRKRSDTILDLSAALTDTIEEHVEYKPAKVPTFEFGKSPFDLTDEEIDVYAALTRKEMGLGDGPISNVTLLVENHSVIVVQVPLPTGMDGLSAWCGDRPFVLSSSTATYARARLNIAHELAHVILHRELLEEEVDDRRFKRIEAQAWRFAGSFLLPSQTFLSELYSDSLDALKLMKDKWGVSIAAMIQRLHGLGAISDSRKKWLRIQLGQRHWLTREPGDDVPREKSNLLSRAAEFLAENGEISLSELVSESKLPRSFLAQALDVAVEKLLPPPPQNVVQFRIRSA